MKTNELYPLLQNVEQSKIQLKALCFSSQPSPLLEAENFEFIEECRLVSRFNALVGNFGILPEHYTDGLYDQLDSKKSGLLSFYDLFNNHSLKLLYSAWKSSQLINLESAYPRKNFFSLVDPSNKWRYYSHLFSFRLRSKAALMQLISAYFELACTDLSYELIQLKSSSEKTFVSELGKNAFLGSILPARLPRLVFIMEPLSEACFNALLKHKDFLMELRSVVKLYTPKNTHFKFKFKVAYSSINLNTLSFPQAIYLGWNSWIGEIRTKAQASIEISSSSCVESG